MKFLYGGGLGSNNTRLVDVWLVVNSCFDRLRKQDVTDLVFRLWTTSTLRAVIDGFGLSLFKFYVHYLSLSFILFFTCFFMLISPFSSSFFLVHISFYFSVFLCLCLFNWVSFRLLSYVSFSSLFFWLWSRNKVESASNLFRCTFEAQCKLFFMAKSSSWFIGKPLIYCYSSFSIVFVFDVVK